MTGASNTNLIDRRSKVTHRNPKTPKELRRFGLVMAVAFAVLSGIFSWRGTVWATWLFWPSGAFLFVGLAVPKALGPVETAWTAFAEVLGRIVTAVILTITFFLVMTPVGFLVRLLSRDSFGRHLDGRATSYWVPVDPDGPISRPDKPF